MLKKLLCLFAFCVLSLGAQAQTGEAKIKAVVEEVLPGAKVTSISKSPYLNLYEVFANGQILYVDEKTSVILVGVLIDTKTKQNVTSERLQKLTAIKFSELPLELAIKQVKGNGERVMATFEDPNCGFCKKLAKEIEKLDNVTFYTFLYPILSPDSQEKSNQIWCSSDRAKAWNDWILNGKAPEPIKGHCDTAAVQQVRELGQNLGITGTPTIIFSNGEKVPGAISKEELDTKLNQIANTDTAKKKKK